MKKIVFILLLAFLSVQAYSQQKGDLTVGVKGGYVYSPHYYKGGLYGFDVAYNLSDPFEIVFTGLTNPNIPYQDVNNTKKNLAVYSANLDFRLYLVNLREWGIGPALGGQYYIVDVTKDSAASPNLGSNKALGFNLGIHGRVNLTDNLVINGGWRYTNAKAKNNPKWYIANSSFDMSYNLFYLGLAYTFELK